MGKKQKRCKTSASGSFIPGFIVSLTIFLRLFRFARFAHFAVELFESNFSIKKAGSYQRRFLKQKT
jgi:hypothetical protein